MKIMKREKIGNQEICLVHMPNMIGEYQVLWIIDGKVVSRSSNDELAFAMAAYELWLKKI